MKKILLTTTALIALGIAPAAAADLAARPYTKAPAAAIAINNWTGFYIGAMGGYAQENSSGIGTLSGGFAGGTAGYNWQTGNFVLGVEADAAWADVGATVGVFGGLASVSDTIRDMGTVRGRVGYAFDSVLIYGTGGYAWADNRITATALAVSISDSQFHSGWTVGRRCRGHVRTEMVGQGRVPLSQLPRRDLLRWRCPGWPCERNAQPEQRSGRRELSLLRLPAETACASVPRIRNGGVFI